MEYQEIDEEVDDIFDEEAERTNQKLSEAMIVKREHEDACLPATSFYIDPDLIKVKSENVHMESKDDFEIKLEEINVSFKTEPEEFNQLCDKKNRNRRLTKSKRFGCILCQKVFRTAGRRNKHFSTHFDISQTNGRSRSRTVVFGSQIFVCALCGELRIIKKEVLNHYQQHYVKNTQLKQRNSFVQRQKKINEIDSRRHTIHEDNKNFSTNEDRCLVKSEVCGKQFSDVNDFELNFQRHGSKYTCKVCCLTFKDEWCLDRHLSIHNMFKCTSCGKEYVSKKDFELHIRTHKKNSTNSGQDKSSSITLKKKLQCYDCSKLFANKTTLLYHIRNFHSLDKKVTTHKFQCHICLVNCRSKAIMEHHLVSHTHERRFRCHLCRNTYRYPQDLQRHMFSHTGERPFVCPYCSKGFIQKGHLNRHLMCHPEEVGSQVLRYCCKICSKKFAQEYMLKLHVKAHSKSFKCEICSKYFSEKRLLKSHLVAHSDVREFRCHICSQEFKFKNSFLRHVKTIHGGQNYKCKLCKKPLTRAEDLKRHMRLHKKSGEIE